MAYEVYWGSGSPYSWYVLLALEVKGLHYHSRLLEFSKREHKTAEFLRLNPRGKVPVLTDGNQVVHESIAILTYLDKKHPTPPLFGTTPDESALIWRTVLEFEHYLRDAMNVIIGAFFSNKIGENSAALRKAVQTVHAEFACYEETLSRSKYLAGASLSAADILFLPFAQLLHRASKKQTAASLELGILFLEKKYPHIAHWTKHIESLPGYEKTYPPHWRN